MYDDEPTLEEMKRAVHILPLAAILGLNPKKIGSGEYVIKCPNPNHEDKTPSCHINHHKNVFHCKGCGAKGTIIDWLMLTERIDQVTAIKRLKEEYSKIGSIKQSIVVEEKIQAPVNIHDPQIQSALRYYIDFCHKIFLSKTEGAAYLMKRGLIYGELAEEFKIGFSDGSLNPGSMNIKESEVYKALFDIGILKNEDGSSNGSTREHFASRVIFPVYDENGLIVQIYGRNIGAIGPKHMLLSGVSLSLFNPKALISPEIILCESVIDALSIMAMGYRNVAAVLSVNGLKDDLFEKIINSDVKKVFIAFDNDNPGNNAASLLSEKLIEHKIESYRIVFEENSDANDLLKKSESIEMAKEHFKKCLENAPALKQVIDTVQSNGYHADSLTKKGKEYFYKVGQRQYTIRGLDQNKSDSALKIFLKLNLEDKFHIDNNLDLFNAKTTGVFSRAAASKLTLDDRVISSDLDSLTIKLDELLKKTIEEKESKKEVKKKEFHKNLETAFKARSFLTEPLIIVKFIQDMEKAGVVGEPLNMFVGFVSTFSRFMKYPLHLIIQSESSAGKSNMLNLLSKLVPEEDMIYLTQVTPRSFYYGAVDFLKFKSIFMAEAGGLKEAEFAIKQFMSELRLAISSTKTDPKTGEHTSDNREIEGPAQIIITEPLETISEEIINRSLLLILDMSLEQTKRIMDFQRFLKSPDGLTLKKQKEAICDFYRHVQRELQPLEVINTFSQYLTFNATSHQARRDHQKYLTLLDCISVLFQHQREKVYKDGKVYVKIHPIDIDLCNFLSRFIFAHCLEHMPPQTVLFTNEIARHFMNEAKKKTMEFEQIWFYRKEAREITGLSNTRTHEHINRMVDHEILTWRRDQNGISYRFLIKPEDDGSIRHHDRLNLVRMPEILKHASKKERQEYEDFKPYLEQTFKALDPKYKGEGK